MKTIGEYINEAREIEYRVSFIGPKTSDDIPFTVTISVDRENVKAFEKFLKDEQDNIFFHAEGGNIEY